MDKKLKENLEFVFKNNKEENQVHVAPDGHIFLEKAKGHAVSHANRLDGKLKVVTRDEVFVTESSNDAPTDLNEMTIKQLKKYAEDHSIEIKSSKKDDILAEIKLAESTQEETGKVESTETEGQVEGSEEGSEEVNKQNADPLADPIGNHLKE